MLVPFSFCRHCVLSVYKRVPFWSVVSIRHILSTLCSDTLWKIFRTIFIRLTLCDPISLFQLIGRFLLHSIFLLPVFSQSIEVSPFSLNSFLFHSSTTLLTILYSVYPDILWLELLTSPLVTLHTLINLVKFRKHQPPSKATLDQELIVVRRIF